MQIYHQVEISKDFHFQADFICFEFSIQCEFSAFGANYYLCLSIGQVVEF